MNEKNKAALALLDKWLADDSGYDEKTWPKLVDAIRGGQGRTPGDIIGAAFCISAVLVITVAVAGIYAGNLIWEVVQG